MKRTIVAGLLFAVLACADSDGKRVYSALQQFQLSGSSAVAENLVLKRDRAEITFNGRFYFEAPIAGRVFGAVFVGNGLFRVTPPPEEFERENVRRLLKADTVETDFRTAVLRFTDDTMDMIGKNVDPAGAAPSDAQRLGAEFNPRILRQAGANLAARVAVAILNAEQPGFFAAQFDGGRRDRCALLFDPQSRIPVAAFNLNGGEKGVVFAHRGELEGLEVWVAFFSMADYERGSTAYADTFDVVNIRHYSMQVDVTEPKRVLKVIARMDMAALADGLRAVPLVINADLPEYQSIRLKKALRLKRAAFADGAPLDAVQEDWEGGVTLYLPKAIAKEQALSAILEFEGDFMYDSPDIPEVFYPRATGDWYPRHGYLNRSTFDITFRHRKQFRVASAGVRLREEPVAGTNDVLTQWKIEQPIALITFGAGRFERHAETIKNKQYSLPVEFYSLPSSHLAIKEDFILAELGNSVQYFGEVFGRYPYPQFAAMYHPRAFGQGFATMMLLPRSDRANRHTFAFIAHETAHQWWGNIVAWRSYRDQWLSEGFAEYSGVLYTIFRDKKASRKEMIEELRNSLKNPPRTDVGVGKGKLVDIGPLILGHRLRTRESLNAYNTLIYNKGALVLRMLHFLFSDPGTGDGQPFFSMMTDFVKRHHDGWATTDTFRTVANEHFVNAGVGRKYGLKDLNWFFHQWVYQTHLPSYRLVYHLEDQSDGSTVLKGTVYQENAGEKWFMPLPLVLRFGGNKMARGTVHAFGPETPVAVKLPGRPESVELDPDLWVLSEKTTTTRTK